MPMRSTIRRNVRRAYRDLVKGGRSGLGDSLNGFGGFHLSDDNNVHGDFFNTHFQFLVGVRGNKVQEKKKKENGLNGKNGRKYFRNMLIF